MYVEMGEGVMVSAIAVEAGSPVYHSVIPVTYANLLKGPGLVT